LSIFFFWIKWVDIWVSYNISSMPWNVANMYFFGIKRNIYLNKTTYFFFYWILQHFLTKSVCFTFVVVCSLWTVTAAIVVKFNFRFVIKIFVFIIFSKLTDTYSTLQNKTNKRHLWYLFILYSSLLHSKT
jgi:hypothetical protein